MGVARGNPGAAPHAVLEVSLDDERGGPAIRPLHDGDGVEDELLMVGDLPRSGLDVLGGVQRLDVLNHSRRP